MKIILIILISLISSSAFAEQPIASNELLSLLLKNREEIKNGTNDFNAFVVSIHKIADNGDPVAQFIYGLFISSSNKQVGIEYLKKSSEQGCAGATSTLGLIYMSLGQYDDGIKMIKLAATKGDAGAQAGLAGLYMRGDHGFPKDLPRAWAWAKLAERQVFSLGSLHELQRYIKTIENAGTEKDLKIGKQIYAELAQKYPKKDYYICGQGNIDTSREPEIENLLSPVIH